MKKANLHIVSPDNSLDRDVAPEKGYFTTKDGAQIYFEDTGGPGTTLFFIYGLGCSICHWKYTRNFFSADNKAADQTYRQVWLDFRGHGKSAPLKRRQRLTIKRIAKDIIELCDYRGVYNATFLGQSMGGSIALELADRTKGLVSGLILLASPAKDPSESLPLGIIGKTAWLSMIELNKKSPLAVRLIYKALKKLSVPMREIIRHEGFNANLTRTEDIQEYVEKLLETNPNIFYDLADDLRSFDVANYDPPISCPALILCGANDHVIPVPVGRWLARLLPKSELEIIRHGSHCPHFDDPGTVNRRIAKFLKLHNL